MIGLQDLVSLTVMGGSLGLSMGTAFLFVRWLAAFVAGRVDAKTAHIDASTAQLIAGLERRIVGMTEREKAREQHLAEREAAWDRWREEVEKELADCRRKHSESEAEVLRLRAMLQGYGDARQLAQLQVAAEKTGGGK